MLHYTFSSIIFLRIGEHRMKKDEDGWVNLLQFFKPWIVSTYLGQLSEILLQETTSPL